MLPFIFLSSKMEKVKKKREGRISAGKQFRLWYAKIASGYALEFDLGTYCSNFMIGIC